MGCSRKQQSYEACFCINSMQCSRLENWLMSDSDMYQALQSLVHGYTHIDSFLDQMQALLDPPFAQASTLAYKDCRLSAQTISLHARLLLFLTAQVHVPGMIKHHLSSCLGNLKSAKRVYCLFQLTLVSQCLCKGRSLTSINTSWKTPMA